MAVGTASIVHVADDTEDTLKRTVTNIATKHGEPCGFVYQHSASRMPADDHTQLRWALLAAKHLSPHLQTAFAPQAGAIGRCWIMRSSRSVWKTS